MQKEPLEKEARFVRIKSIELLQADPFRILFLERIVRPVVTCTQYASKRHPSRLMDRGRHQRHRDQR